MKTKMLIGLMAVMLTSGCAIQKYNRPPEWSSAVITHARFYGLDASIPYTGGSLLKVQLGWGSSTYTVLPVSTQAVFTPRISDTFSIGQSLSPFDTTIREYLQTSWESTNMPSPAMNLFRQPTINIKPNP